MGDLLFDSDEDHPCDNTTDNSEDEEGENDDVDDVASTTLTFTASPDVVQATVGTGIASTPCV